MKLKCGQQIGPRGTNLPNYLLPLLYGPKDFSTHGHANDSTAYAACLSALRSLGSHAAARSSTSHSRSVTPAAIAGVTRSVR